MVEQVIKSLLLMVMKRVANGCLGCLMYTGFVEMVEFRMKVCETC